MGEIIRPAQAAKILGVSSESVRQHMKRGLWDIGDAISPKQSGKTVWEFNIYPAKLSKLVGRDIAEEVKDI